MVLDIAIVLCVGDKPVRPLPQVSGLRENISYGRRVSPNILATRWECAEAFARTVAAA